MDVRRDADYSARFLKLSGWALFKHIDDTLRYGRPPSGVWWETGHPLQLACMNCERTHKEHRYFRGAVITFTCRCGGRLEPEGDTPGKSVEDCLEELNKHSPNREPLLSGPLWGSSSGACGN